MKYQIGDVVSFGGDIGIVTTLYPTDDCPLRVCFKESDMVEYFTLDGRYSLKHTEPLLKFISRPIKKVKRVFYTGIELMPGTPTGYSADGLLISDKDKANEWFKNYDGIATVEVYLDEVLKKEQDSVKND